MPDPKEPPIPNPTPPSARAAALVSLAVSVHEEARRQHGGPEWHEASAEAVCRALEAAIALSRVHACAQQHVAISQTQALLQTIAGPSKPEGSSN
jgi:hypothetical protein